MKRERRKKMTLPDTVLVSIVGALAVVIAAFITGRYAFRANRKSASEVNGIATEQLDLEERKTSMNELNAVIVQLRIDMADVRNRMEKLETTNQHLNEVNTRLTDRVFQLTDYIWRMIAVFRNTGNSDKIPSPPPDGFTF